MPVWIEYEMHQTLEKIIISSLEPSENLKYLHSAHLDHTVY